MHTRALTQTVVAGGVAVALALGVSIVQAKAAPDDAWNLNGATACEKFLTVDVMSSVLVKPSGSSSKDNAKSCHRGSIHIALSSGSVEKFKQRMDHIPMATAMTGVGDAAYWNPAGDVSAIKAPDRQCDISVSAVPSELRAKDEALGQALGAVCNQLFALK
jgi:hypothetical protein